MFVNGRREQYLDRMLLRSPAQRFMSWLASRRLVVLAYHEISDPAAFAWQVDYMSTFMRPVSLGEVAGAISSGRALPPRAILITFDDGDRTVYEHAMPILRERGIPAVAFVVAGLLGTDTPLWWREVEELVRRGARTPGLLPDPEHQVRVLKDLPNSQRVAWIEQLRGSLAGATAVTTPQLQPSEVMTLDAAGIAIGNHTLTHPCLDRCTAEEIGREVVEAHELLADILGKAPTTFAYPNGNVDERATKILKTLGYRTALLFDHRIGRFPPSDPFRISRVRVNSTTPPDRFRIIVSGLHPLIHHLIGRE